MKLSEMKKIPSQQLKTGFQSLVQKISNHLRTLITGAPERPFVVEISCVPL